MGNPFADHDWHRSDPQGGRGGSESWKAGRPSALVGGVLAAVTILVLVTASGSKSAAHAAGLTGAAGGLLGAMALWRFRAEPPGAGWWFLATGSVWVSLWPVVEMLGFSAMFWQKR